VGAIEVILNLFGAALGPVTTRHLIGCREAAGGDRQLYWRILESTALPNNRFQPLDFHQQLGDILPGVCNKI
jgi:hypothetical protein